MLLKDGPHPDNQMSAEICYKICTKGNRFNYFGTQNEGDCYCGEVADIESYNTYKRDKSQCNNNCNGNDDEKCGSTDNASVYKLKVQPTRPSTKMTTTSVFPPAISKLPRDDPGYMTSSASERGNYGNETTTTNGLPTNTANNVTLAATFPIIVESALAFLLIAVVLVSIAVCYRKKKTRDSQPFDIQQNQIIAENNDSAVYTEVMNNDITIIKTKEDKDENKTIHLKTQGVAASVEQDNKYESLLTDRYLVEHNYESDSIHTNPYESLTTNRNLVEHTYESDCIHNNPYESLTKQWELDKQTYESTEHAISQDIKTSIGQEDEVCNKYESLSTNRISVEHTYESDLIQANQYESLSTNRISVEHTYESDIIHANQYESLSHKQEFEKHIYDSPELALHTSTESNVNQYQSHTMHPELDTHVYASTVPYGNKL
ncbi:Hypothetical predicted protein [Mytilus galloprovincialis]|uniref:WSC domain-containing protein n=1 Tax=Mytilus galloprovincialis TaxID=29158 RepID=A0A8B6BQH5_MYTGA|nr:Hypothetical predicted protein [Mytilus galloprovincialis]